MDYPGDFGRNLSNNSLGQLTPYSSTPHIGAQAIQAPFHSNASEPFSGATMPWSGGHPDANALVAPQTFQPESNPYCTMPQAGVPGAAAAQPGINFFMSQPCQPNNYNTHGGHGWPQPPPHQQQQAPPASGYSTLQLSPAPQDAHFHQRAPPVGANSYGATNWAPPMPHAGWPASWVPPVQQQPGGQASWAPPVQHHVEQRQTIWAPPEQIPGVPAVSPANGSGQPPAPAPAMTFEEFLMDAGVLNEWAGDDMVLQGLMQNLQAELGQGEPDAPMAAASLGEIGPGGGGGGGGAGAVSSFYGLSRDQVGLYMAQAQEEEEEEEPVGSAGRNPEAAAAGARARRIRRMAKRKEAIARARPGN